MEAQMRKMRTNRQTKHENKRSQQFAHGNDETRWNTSPPKLDFLSTLPNRIAISTCRHLFQMCAKWRPKAFEIEARGCLWRKKLVGERFTKHVKKQASEKYDNMSKTYPKKVPRKDIFLWFSRSGAKGVPGWSQRPSRAPYKVKSFRKFAKKWWAESDFCDVLLGLVPDWTHMPPGASAVLPDVPGLFQSSHPCKLQRAT